MPMTLRLPTEALHRLRLGHITADIRLRFAPPKCSATPRTSYVRKRYLKDCALKGDAEYGEQRKSERIYAKGD
jgi:hypothetical protein